MGKRRRRDEDEEDLEDIREEFDSEDEIEEEDEDEGEKGADDEDEEDDEDGEDEEEKEEAEPEPEPEPDNQDAVAALRELGCRVDINDAGRAWRIFLYERHRDNAVAQIHGLPCLKEIWLVGSLVSNEMAENLREAMPDSVKIYR